MNKIIKQLSKYLEEKNYAEAAKIVKAGNTTLALPIANFDELFDDALGNKDYETIKTLLEKGYDRKEWDQETVNKLHEIQEIKDLLDQKKCRAGQHLANNKETGFWDFLKKAVTSEASSAAMVFTCITIAGTALLVILASFSLMAPGGIAAAAAFLGEAAIAFAPKLLTWVAPTALLASVPIALGWAGISTYKNHHKYDEIGQQLLESEKPKIDKDTQQKGFLGFLQKVAKKEVIGTGIFVASAISLTALLIATGSVGAIVAGVGIGVVVTSVSSAITTAGLTFLVSTIAAGVALSTPFAFGLTVAEDFQKSDSTKHQDQLDKQRKQISSEQGKNKELKI